MLHTFCSFVTAAVKTPYFKRRLGYKKTSQEGLRRFVRTAVEFFILCLIIFAKVTRCGAPGCTVAGYFYSELMMDLGT